jgi:hypothetical protein
VSDFESEKLMVGPRCEPHRRLTGSMLRVEN